MANVKVMNIITGLSKNPVHIMGCSRLFSGQANTPKSPAKGKAPSSGASAGDVAGLSSAVFTTPTGEVGPGASKTGNYKNPEYFSYNRMSYHEAEIEMHKYRQPQPSNKVPLTS